MSVFVPVYLCVSPSPHHTLLPRVSCSGLGSSSSNFLLNVFLCVSAINFAHRQDELLSVSWNLAEQYFHQKIYSCICPIQDRICLRVYFQCPTYDSICTKQACFLSYSDLICLQYDMVFTELVPILIQSISTVSLSELWMCCCFLSWRLKQRELVTSGS